MIGETIDVLSYLILMLSISWAVLICGWWTSRLIKSKTEPNHSEELINAELYNLGEYLQSRFPEDSRIGSVGSITRLLLEELKQYRQGELSSPYHRPTSPFTSDN